MSHQRSSAWAIAAGGLLAYAGLMGAAAATGIPIELPLPAWLSQMIPPIVYGSAVAWSMRHASVDRWFVTTLLLWAAHLVLASLGQLVTGRSPVFPPPPLPALLCVPLLLVPLRDLLSPFRPRHDHRRARRHEPRRPAAGHGRSGEAASSARATSPTQADAPTIAAEPRLDVAAVAAPSGDEALAAGATLPPASSPAAATSAAQRLVDEMIEREAGGADLKISFDRIVGQLPPAALLAPPERVAEGLTEPGYILIPRRLALVQLGEGLVRAGWEVVAAQFPRALLGLTDQEITRHLTDGQLVLPLDEVVRQMPGDLFHAAGPSPDWSGIESFPEPFQQVSPVDADEVTVEPPANVRLVEPADGIEDRATPPMPVTVHPMPEHGVSTVDSVASAPATVPSEPHAEPVAEPAAATEREEEIGDDDLTRALTRSLEDREPVREALAIESHAPVLSHEQAPSADLRIPVVDPIRMPEPAASVAMEHAAAPQLPVSERAPSSVSIAPESLSSAPELGAAREIAARLTPLMALDVDAQVVDGVTLYTVCAAGVSPERCLMVSRSMLTFLDDPRAPWPVAQMTLRGPALAMVLTPLGSPVSGGPVLAVMLPPNGSLALLEILCRRAAVAVAGHEPADRVMLDRELDEPELLDVEPPTRTLQLASSLDAVGPVSVSALRDAESEERVFLFLPAGSDTRVIGGFAADVSRAVRSAADFGAVFTSAVLRSGERFTAIQLLDSSARGVVVAAGVTDRPGLAFRQVDRAAMTLAAV